MNGNMTLSYTLLADGPTDAALLPILDWLLKTNGINGSIEGKWADLGRYPLQARQSLACKITMTVELYRSNLLFIHRDAERGPRYRDIERSYEQRLQEIADAIELAGRGAAVAPNVCVIPVRMTEAWLLFDEDAIRKAAGNPNGTLPLSLPRLQDLETLPDPKNMLKSIIADASGLKGRRLKNFPFPDCVRQISRHTDTFAALRSLSAFRHLEHDIHAAVLALH